MEAKIFIAILISSFLINLFNARYIKNLSEDRRFWAATYGELVQICGAVVVYNYVHNLWYLVPMVIGGFAGTYFYKSTPKK